MAATLYTQSDVKPVLRGRTIAVLGYGNQGHAHAQNLRDGGYRVLVGADPERPSAQRARADGFPVLRTGEAVQEADFVSILLPDESHGAIYAASIAPHLRPGQVLGFAHGFSLHYRTLEPPAGIDTVLVSPKGQGHLLRRLFVEGKGTPALVAVAQDASGHALDYALAYAAGIGCARAGMLATTFREETETDLFGEQAVLCGGLSALIKAGYETLVAAGYQPEVAYFECLHETKLIVDLLVEGGLASMRHAISNTAEYGDLTQGPRLIGEATRQVMRELLADIQSGRFARAWIEENRNGCPNLNRLREAERRHPIEAVGARLRALMPWLAAAANPEPRREAAPAAAPPAPTKLRRG